MREWERVPNNQKEVIEPFLTRVPIKIQDMAYKLGIEVMEDDLGPNVAGKINKNTQKGEKPDYRISVHWQDPVEVQRFTVAHEIAHYLLHEEKISDGITDSSLYFSKIPDKLEMEANRLAAYLIAPDDQIIKTLKKRGWRRSRDTAEKMADEFKVPLWLMEIKLGV